MRLAVQQNPNYQQDGEEESTMRNSVRVQQANRHWTEVVHCLIDSAESNLRAVACRWGLVSNAAPLQCEDSAREYH